MKRNQEIIRDKKKEKGSKKLQKVYCWNNCFLNQDTKIKIEFWSFFFFFFPFELDFFSLSLFSQFPPVFLINVFELCFFKIQKRGLKKKVALFRSLGNNGEFCWTCLGWILRQGINSLMSLELFAMILKEKRLESCSKR